MRASTENLDWVKRAGLVWLIWALLFPFLGFSLGDVGATVLVVLSVVLVLGGAEWVVKGMRFEERWRRMASFAITLILLSAGCIAITAFWLFARAQLH
jgi:hypothetical protein